MTQWYDIHDAEVLVPDLSIILMSVGSRVYMYNTAVHKKFKVNIFSAFIFYIFYIYSCIKQMSKILKIEASYIDGSNFIVPCDCSRKFHKFGNCKDKISNRTEYRGMCGHLCDKYTDCEANITVNTLRVDQIPKSRVLK
eukprot:SAG11_NODE_20039_length_453_cov_12.406780_1_plen_138_part_10